MKNSRLACSHSNASGFSGSPILCGLINNALTCPSRPLTARCTFPTYSSMASIAEAAIGTRRHNGIPNICEFESTGVLMNIDPATQPPAHCAAPLETASPPSPSSPTIVFVVGSYFPFRSRLNVDARFRLGNRKSCIGRFHLRNIHIRALPLGKIFPVEGRNFPRTVFFEN